jgi:GDP-L-fucose synthase
MIQKVVGYNGGIVWDDSKPDGTPKKLMDSLMLNNEGWKSLINLEKGIKMTYDWFLSNQESIKKLKFS